MKITEIKFRMAPSEEPQLIAFASCVVDDCLYLNNIAIRKKYDGTIYLNFPRYITHGGNEYPYFKPINREMYEIIKRALLDALSVNKSRENRD